MSLKKLRERKAGIAASMGTIQAKGEDIEKVDLDAIKSFADDIKNIDMQIEAIELTRQHSVNQTRPASEKKDDFKAKQKDSFALLVRGKITTDEHKRNIASYQASVGSYDTAKGEELVPDEFVKILKERVLEFGSIVPELNMLETSAHGAVEMPTMDDTANKAVWVDEHGSLDLKDFATGTITLNAFKVGTGIVISNELVEDSFFDIVVYSAYLLSIRINRAVENAVIVGDGVKKPLGIVNTVAIGTTIKATVEVETASSNAFVSDDLSNLIGAVQSSQRAGAKIYLSEVLLRAAINWKDSTGRKLLQPLASSTDAHDVLYEFEGYKIVPNYELAALADNDISAVFGNLKNYTLRVVRSVRVKASDEVKMMTDETVVVATMRLDGRVTSVNTSFSKLKIKPA